MRSGPKHYLFPSPERKTDEQTNYSATCKQIAMEKHFSAPIMCADRFH